MEATALSLSPERKHLLSRPSQAAEPRSRASSGDQVGLLLLLLLLSCFSHVRLCVTPQMAAHKAPPSLGLSRQEQWSGLPFPSPLYTRMHAKSLQSCPTLCDPMDCSPPGFSIHGILQARTLEWVAISFSNA